MSEQENMVKGERLSRFLAHAGIASRRHAEELIAAGRVQVNGITVTTQGTRIDPQQDHVSVDGKPVHIAVDHAYLLLNKPVGYVSTAHDPQGRPTVLDLLPDELRQLRVYPVGRLDIDTSGLLLLTNDGDFALHLTHPRYSMEKHYEALVQGHPSAVELAALRRGVVITEDNGQFHKTSPAQVHPLRRVGATSWLALTIHEGRKRQVRRMLAAIGHPVLQLARVGVGPLTLKGVPTGKWRYLTHDEVDVLMSIQK
ncbi:MAG TPA: pseudouridine synthase [Ktedonobacteraceae bacterium]|nr:pseudouridine synthase [Ktedonobacteraceae bacterium]